MAEFQTLDKFTTRDGRALTFHRWDDEYAVYLEGEELMSSHAPGSENALAELGCRGLQAGARVLIGGLGLGFTLRAAQAVCPPGVEIVVAEVFSCVIRWNQVYVEHRHKGSLADPRVRIVEADVWREIVRDGPWDAILLDVDNGPDAWCLKSNARLYNGSGLFEIQSALSADGALALWSAYPEPQFLSLLRKNGFVAESHNVCARGKEGAEHTIFLARC